MKNLLLGLIIAFLSLSVTNVILLVVIVKKPKCTITKKSTNTYSIKERILGGHRIEINLHPFIAAIVVKQQGRGGTDNFICGSAIISSQWVVTAAHCITDLDDAGVTKETVFITGGNTNWRKGSRHNIITWINKESYDRTTMNNDIALILVKEPFTGNLEKNIKLAPRTFKYEEGKQVKVIGWGITRLDQVHPEESLRSVDVFIVNHTHCKELYDGISDLPTEVTNTMFCAGTPLGGKDACSFDSGGPIFDVDTLIGIVSWGKDCGKQNQPGVYTKINLYKDWIIKTTKELNVPIVV